MYKRCPVCDLLYYQFSNHSCSHRLLNMDKGKRRYGERIMDGFLLQNRDQD